MNLGNPISLSIKIRYYSARAYQYVEASVYGCTHAHMDAHVYLYKVFSLTGIISTSSVMLIGRLIRTLFGNIQSNLQSINLIFKIYQDDVFPWTTYWLRRMLKAKSEKKKQTNKQTKKNKENKINFCWIFSKHGMNLGI